MKLVPRLLFCALLSTVSAVAPVAASPRVTLYPGVARVGGNNNTAWRSDAVFHNPSAAATTVGLELLPRGSATVTASGSLPLAPGETRTVENLYDFLHAADGAGMLRVSGDTVTWVRTYNQGPTGTFGQDLPGVVPGEGWEAGEVMVFPFSTPADPNRELRSNLLLVNLDAAAITVTVRAGTIEKTKSVDAGTYAQVDNLGVFLGAPAGFGAARVWATGRFFAVVSTVDPVTGDPTTVRGLTPSAPGERLFAGVARIAGNNQTAWRSEATLFNPGESAVQVRIELIPRGSGAVAASSTLTLAAGETRRIGDLYETLAVTSGAGALRVSAGVLAWVRTFNQGAQGTFGQDLPPIDAAVAAGAQIPVALPFRAAASIQTDFRSNLVVQNLESRGITLSVRAGSTERTQTVGAGAYTQIDNLGAFLGLPPGAYTAWVQADGSWAGTISTIDPFTGDPTTLRDDRESAPASSYDFIDQALADQTVDAEQALVYKVYADFADPALPPGLRGDDRNAGEGVATGEAAAGFSTLSAATQELVGPYLVQPFYAGSWWDRRRGGGTGAGAFAVWCRPWAVQCPILSGDWLFVDGAHARVWYLKAFGVTDALAAAELNTAVDGTIWAALNTVMGLVPKPDEGEGGSDRYDVVLTDGLAPGNPGKTISTKLFSCTNTPAFTSISRTVTDPDTRRSLLAHEMMHGTQYAIAAQSCIESMRWLAESTASWFEDHVYAAVNREHVYAASYLDTVNLSLDNDGGNPLKPYGGYLFFSYLTKIRGTSPTVVGRIWAATAGADALHAFESGLRAGGAELDKSWPDFAAYALNAYAPFDTFSTQDSLPDQARVAPLRSISLTAPSAYFEVKPKSDLNLPRLSIRYYPFEFPDATVSSLAVFNGLTRSLEITNAADYGDLFSAKPITGPDTVKGGHLTVLVKINGTWKQEHLTNDAGRTYCRDVAAERVESLVVIVSNSDIGDVSSVYPRGQYSPLVFASNVGCAAWEGSANLSLRWGAGVVETMSETGLRLEALADGYYDENTPLFRVFYPVSGEFLWGASGSDQGCTYSGSYAGTTTNALSAFHVLPWTVRGVGHRGIVSVLFWEWLEVRLVMREQCETGSSLVNWHAGEFVLPTIPEFTWARVSPDGKTLTVNGSQVPDHPGLSGSWTLHAVREP